MRHSQKLWFDSRDAKLPIRTKRIKTQMGGERTNENRVAASDRMQGRATRGWWWCRGANMGLAKEVVWQKCWYGRGRANDSGGTEGPLREKKSKGVKLKEKLKQEEEDGWLRGKNRSSGMERKGDGTVKKYQGRKLCGPPKRGCSMS